MKTEKCTKCGWSLTHGLCVCVGYVDNRVMTAEDLINEFGGKKW